MASTPVPAIAVPANVAAARQQVQTSDFFALCYLMLANLAYADEDNAQKAIQQITNLLPTMPVPQATVAGKWRLAWGPQAVLNDNSNLMYGAEFSDSVSGLPVFAAVVIRGTDTQANPSGVITQLVEDLDVENQVVFPSGNQVGSKIAQGTQACLNILTGFTDSSNRTIDQYLNGFVAENPRAPVVVTGHSLGGCQTTVMALYLSGKLPGGTSIVPTSFAAPTAGNPAFIQLYEQTFPFCPRWFNTLDLVPMAFAGFNGIKQLWSQCGRPAPQAVKLVLDGFVLLLRTLGVGYAQQSSTNSRSLAGTCQPQAAVSALKVPLDQIVNQIQASIRSRAGKLHIPVPDFLFLGIIDWVKELLFQHLVPTGYWNVVAASPGVAPVKKPFPLAAAAGGNP
jgi:triacylglycerol lipase